MKKETAIQYATAKLQAQREAIAKSRLDAMEKITRDAYGEITGLDEKDPVELWRFAVGRIEQPPNLIRSDAAGVLAGHIQAYQRFRNSFGTTTLQATVLSLANRVQDDSELAKHLSKLLQIVQTGQISRNSYHEACAYADTTTRRMIENWIEEPPTENWITKSLCFYSDRAMAKLLYFLAHGGTETLPATRLTTEPERIRKLYRGLGLMPARPRVIKDLLFQAGKFRWIPYKKATSRQP